MCPACIESTVAMVAGAGSAAGILAAYIGRLREFVRASGLARFREQRRNDIGNDQERNDEHAKGKVAMKTPPII
jgi:hypothetical protein